MERRLRTGAATMQGVHGEAGAHSACMLQGSQPGHQDVESRVQGQDDMQGVQQHNHACAAPPVWSDAAAARRPPRGQSNNLPQALSFQLPCAARGARGPRSRRLPRRPWLEAHAHKKTRACSTHGRASGEASVQGAGQERIAEPPLCCARPFPTHTQAQFTQAQTNQQPHLCLPPSRMAPQTGVARSGGSQGAPPLRACRGRDPQKAGERGECGAGFCGLRPTQTAFCFITGRCVGRRGGRAPPAGLRTAAVGAQGRQASNGRRATAGCWASA